MIKAAISQTTQRCLTASLTGLGRSVAVKRGVGLSEAVEQPVERIVSECIVSECIVGDRIGIRHLTSRNAGFVRARPCASAKRYLMNI